MSADAFDDAVSAFDPPPQNISATEASAAGSLRVFLSYVRPQRSALLIGVVLALLSSGTALTIPLVAKWTLDSLGTGASLTRPVIALVLLTVVGAALGYIQWVIIGTAAENVVYQSRLSLARRLFESAVPALQGRSIGELVTRTTSDTVLLREASSSSTIGIFNATVLGVGTLVMMAYLDIALFAVTLVAVGSVAATFKRLMARIVLADNRSQQALGELGGSLEAGLRAIRTVKASRAEQRIVGRIDVAATAARNHSLEAMRATAAAWTIATMGIHVAIVVVLGLGAWRVDQHDLALSTLIAFLLYAFTLTTPLTELSIHLSALQSGMAAAARIMDTERLPSETQSTLSLPRRSRPPESKVPGSPLIAFESVDFRYNNVRNPTLHNVTLDIPTRGHIAIVGPSGAGKTTLLSLILRFLEPDSGELRLRGESYPSLSHASIRRHLAYVEQETPVIPGTIRDNLVFTHPDVTDTEIADVLRRLRLDSVIAGLPHGLDSTLTPSLLSGGQRQRIALARAIIRPVELLILDEATAQVDALTEAIIIDCVRELAQSNAVLTVAHRLSTIQNADCIHILESGSVRASGNHIDLLESDALYRDLVAAAYVQPGQNGHPA